MQTSEGGWQDADGCGQGVGSNFCDFLRRSSGHDPKVTQFKTRYNFLGWRVGFVRLLVLLNDGFQNNRLYIVNMNNKLVKLIQLNLTKLSYELMVVTTLTGEIVFDGLLN